MTTFDTDPKILQLFDKFVGREVANESDEKIGDDLLELILSIGRLLAGVEDGTAESRHQQDLITLNRLAQFDNDNSELAVAQIVFNRLGIQKTTKAAQYLKDSIERRQKAFSETQSRRSKSRNRVHPYKAVVGEMVDVYCSLSAKEIVTQLIKAAPPSTSDLYFYHCESGDEFIFEGSAHNTLKVRTIHNWISEFKKALK